MISWFQTHHRHRRYHHIVHNRQQEAEGKKGDDPVRQQAPDLPGLDLGVCNGADEGFISLYVISGRWGIG
jgi:hypothetical protein